MRVKEALEKGIAVLKDANIEAPVLVAGALLCNVMNCDRTWIYTHGEEEIASGTVEAFLFRLELRAQGKPLQHITGRQEFMSLDFRVNSHVLIPRQDTEILVEAALQYGRALGGERGLRILDIGTGSGCIAVSLAHYLENCCVTAIDISAEALGLARDNAALNRVENRIAFVRGDIFELWERAAEDGRYDIIASNPPYIRSEEIASLQREVRDHEPTAALDGGSDGLRFYRFITAKAPGYLKPGGYLAFEVGYDQAEQVGGLMKENFEEIKIIKDLSGIGRVVAGKLKKET